MNKSEYSNAEFLLKKIREADAVLVGAASGLSAADGRRFWYEDDEEFRKVFGPFRDKYGVRSAFDGFYYPYRTENERWALNATLIHHLYETKAGQVYKDLTGLLQDKPCHIMTAHILWESGPVVRTSCFSRTFPQTKFPPSRATGAISSDRMADASTGSGTTAKWSMKCMPI